MLKAHMPEKLFEEIEGLVSSLKTYRAKDEHGCEKLQHILSCYKEACNHCEQRKVQVVADKLCKAEESLDITKKTFDLGDILGKIQKYHIAKFF